ncbi:MAG: class I SAM-dependent methyltransferase [Actinomycetes bacterium]
MVGGDRTTDWRNSYTRVRKDPFRDDDRTNRTRLSRLGVDQLAQSARVLDVGAGDGNLARSLTAAGFGDVVGVEYQPELLALHPDRHRTVVGSATALPLPAGSVDAVVVMDVLHHVPLPDQPAALAELRRVLRPGGHLFVCEPAQTTTRRVLDAALHSPLHRLTEFSRDKRAMVDAEGPTFVDWLRAEHTFPTAVRSAGFTLERFERKWLHHFGRWRRD